jgi:hypothetical protein
MMSGVNGELRRGEACREHRQGPFHFHNKKQPRLSLSTVTAAEGNMTSLKPDAEDVVAVDDLYGALPPSATDEQCARRHRLAQERKLRRLYEQGRLPQREMAEVVSLLGRPSGLSSMPPAGSVDRSIVRPRGIDNSFDAVIWRPPR